MEIWEAILLGIVEGITEFLPVSSTGHLTITEKLLGMRIDDPAVTAYTAIIQIGAIAAAIFYFWRDISRFTAGFFRGLVSAQGRRSPDWQMALYVIAASAILIVAALAFKDLIEGAFRSMWFVGGALIAWSGVMVFAERAATQQRGEDKLNWKDIVFIGVVQCFSLIPGVSRSGATISAGLLRDLDRVTATRLSFFLGIPALTAAGLFQAYTEYDQISKTIGWVPTGVGTVVSFIVAYASIAWLLKFVANHSIVTFVWYRVALGLAIFAALGTGLITAT